MWTKINKQQVSACLTVLVLVLLGVVVTLVVVVTMLAVLLIVMEAVTAGEQVKKPDEYKVLFLCLLLSEYVFKSRSHLSK